MASNEVLVSKTEGSYGSCITLEHAGPVKGVASTQL